MSKRLYTTDKYFVLFDFITFGVARMQRDFAIYNLKK